MSLEINSAQNKNAQKHKDNFKKDKQQDRNQFLNAHKASSLVKTIKSNRLINPISSLRIPKNYSQSQIASKRPNKSVYACDDCKRIFRDLNNYKEHRFQEHNEAHSFIRQCTLCSYSTTLKSKYDCHMKCHDHNKIIRCVNCNYSTINIRHMSKHERMHFMDDTDTKNDCTCMDTLSSNEESHDDDSICFLNKLKCNKRDEVFEMVSSPDSDHEDIFYAQSQANLYETKSLNNLSITSNCYQNESLLRPRSNSPAADSCHAFRPYNSRQKNDEYDYSLSKNMKLKPLNENNQDIVMPNFGNHYYQHDNSNESILRYTEILKSYNIFITDPP